VQCRLEHVGKGQEDVAGATRGRACLFRLRRPAHRQVRRSSASANTIPLYSTPSLSIMSTRPPHTPAPSSSRYSISPVTRFPHGTLPTASPLRRPDSPPGRGRLLIPGPERALYHTPEPVHDPASAPDLAFIGILSELQTQRSETQRLAGALNQLVDVVNTLQYVLIFVALLAIAQPFRSDTTFPLASS
jgi:hypothetical protein